MPRLLSGSAFGWRPEWTDRALSPFRGDDSRFTDEEILMILYAGEAGLNLAEVCAAGSIRLDTYLSWQGKYNGLTPAEVRQRRLRERRTRRGTMTALVAVASVGAVGLLIGIPTRSSSDQASGDVRHSPPESSATAPAATSTLPGPGPNRQSVTAARQPIPSPPVHQPSPPAAAAARPAANAVGTARKNAGDIQTSAPNGYAVQVAAVPDLREARAVLEQLGDAGYRAYLTATTVDHVEMYRVRVGPLKSRIVAEEIARRLEREGHRAAWVTK